MEQIDYAGALRRSWRLVIILGLLGALVAVLIPASTPKKATGTSSYVDYQATMVVGSAPAGPGQSLSGGVTDAQIQFYAGSSTVRANTLTAIGINPTPYTMGIFLTATPDGKPSKHGKQSLPVLLVGRDTSASGATNLVNEYSNQLSAYLVNLVSAHQSSNSNANVTTQSIGYEVIQPASASVPGKGAKKASITSSRKVRALIGLAVGLLLAALIVLARELLDKRIRNAGRAESTFGYPVVVEIPRDAAFRASSKVALEIDVISDPDSPAAEAYRMLRMSVLFEALAPRAAATDGLDFLLGNGLAHRGNGNGNGSALAPLPASASAPSAPDSQPLSDPVGARKVVLVVSAGTEPTRAQVAVNFAATYAEAGQRAVVISTAELGTGRFAVPTGTLTGELRSADVESRLDASSIEGIYRLPLSDFVDNSGQLVTRAPAVIDAARSIADVVVVEAPPLLAVHHAEALSHAVDVVLVVGECWTTTFDAARRAGEVLRRMEAPVLGVVLTNVRLSRRDLRHRPSTDLEPPRPPGPVSDKTQQIPAEVPTADVSSHSQA